MKRIIVLLILLLVPLSSAFAQEQTSKKDFNDIKTDIAEILIENKQLEEEHAHLQHTLETVQEGINKYRTALQQLSARAEDRLASRKDASDKINGLGSDMEDVNSQLLVKKGWITKYNKELLDIKERTGLWELKLSELKNIKSGLDAELKLKRAVLEEDKRKSETVIPPLRAKIEAGQKALEEIIGQRNKLEKEREELPGKIKKLQDEITGLTNELVLKQKENVFQVKENKLLKDKKLLAYTKKDVRFLQFRQEREELARITAQLEEKYEKLNDNVTQNLQVQHEEKELLNKILVLDKENQMLRSLVERKKDEDNR